MAGTPRDIPTLEGWFQTGDKPSQQQFYDLFVSFVHYLQVKQVTGASTSDIMSQKATTDSINAAIAALKDSVPVGGDTLNKLYNLIVSIGEFVGNHNASLGLPSTGSGTAGAIDKGDYWLITTGGTIGGLGTLAIGDVLFAKQNGASAAAHFFYLPFATLVADATEIVKGVIEIATQAETDAGTDNVRAVTPLKLANYAAPVVDLGNLSGAVSIDLATGRNFKCVFTGNVTSFTFANEKLGAVYYLDITTTAFRTIAFTAAKFRLPLGLAPTLTNPASNGVGTAIDTLVFKCSVSGRLDVVITPDLQPN